MNAFPSDPRARRVSQANCLTPALLGLDSSSRLENVNPQPLPTSSPAAEEPAPSAPSLLPADTTLFCHIRVDGIKKTVRTQPHPVTGEAHWALSVVTSRLNNSSPFSS
jgi:hypothetical protein